MFAWLKDYLKNLEKKEKKEKQEEENQEKKSNEKDSSEKSNNLDNQPKPEESIKKKKIKRKKKRKKKKRKKPTFFSLGIYIIFVIFFASHILLLKSPKTYELSASLEYNKDLKKYEIIYDIEKLWNDNHYKVGDKVCIPEYFNKNDIAIQSELSNCIPGEIIKAGNKVEIRYNIPKYITKNELDLSLDTKTIKTYDYSKVKIKIKRFLGMYQIFDIKPHVQ